MLSINLQDVQPLVQKDLSAKQELVSNWITVLSGILNARYGDRITPTNTPIFTFFVAQVIKRMLASPNQTVIKQAMEGASVEYAAHSTKGDLFLSAELSQMDALVGLNSNSARVIKAVSPKFLDQ